MDGRRQRSLFEPSTEQSIPGPEAGVPLAARMRPRTLDEFVGQTALVGPDGLLRRALAQGRLPSMILWGPPGSGKTTLAMLLGEALEATWVPISAVESGVKELREVLVQARSERAHLRRVVLFVDELHRWSKSQQDAVLPAVESGLLILIGATTENPGFEIVPALRSRVRLFHLQPLTEDEVGTIVDRAMDDVDRGLVGGELAPEARQLLLQLAGGDARVALTLLEMAFQATPPEDTGRRVVGPSAIREAADRPVAGHDRMGDAHYDVISALIKSVRGSDPDAAVFWLARALEGGEDPLFVARRLVILAAEDIGLAEPQALPLAVAAYQATHFIGMPECYLPLSEAVLFLALAPKSNSALLAYRRAAEDVAGHPGVAVPLHLRNAVTAVARAEGHGQGYRYAHDYPDGVAPQVHLPPELAGSTYYTGSPLGGEGALTERAEQLRKRLRARDQERE